MQDYAGYRVNQIDSVAVVKLDAPPFNGLSPPMFKALDLLLQDLAENDSIRTLLITGSGSFFCAGGDLGASIGQPDEVRDRIASTLPQLNAAFARFANFPVPVVAALNGNAAGAGMSLAMLADYVVMADNAVLKTAYVSAGLTPDGGLTHSLARLLGKRQATALLYLDEKIQAQRALELGLVSEVVAADQLEARGLALAQKFADGPTASFAAVKALMMSAYETKLEVQMNLEGQALVEAVGSCDGQEGMAAFIERRAPRFNGR